jgi:hypothetical protein
VQYKYVVLDPDGACYMLHVTFDDRDWACRHAQMALEQQANNQLLQTNESLLFEGLLGPLIRPTPVCLLQLIVSRLSTCAICGTTCNTQVRAFFLWLTCSWEATLQAGRFTAKTAGLKLCFAAVRLSPS